MWIIRKLIREQPDNATIDFPLGNQSSQWFALLYLNKIDHFIEEQLRIKHYVIYMDDFILVHRDKKYLSLCKKREEDIENMRFEGGGGTDFDVAVGAFTRRVENKIIFTDGEASMPDTPLDAIWIVFGGEKISPRGGGVIHITPEQLDRLYSYEIESETKGRLR